MIIPVSDEVAAGIAQIAAWCWVIHLLVSRMDNPYDDGDDDDDFD